MVVRMLVLSLLLPTALGTSFNKNYPVQIGQTMMAGGTDPTAGSTGWALTSHGIGEKLFTVDKKGVVVGQIAKSCQKVDKYTWTVNLKTGYKFSDGTVVTAKLVADALTKLNSVNSGAKASLGAMTMKTVDASTLTINSTRATPVMDAVLAEWAFVVFLEKNGNFIFTGPYTIETFKKGEYINLAPNQYYPRAWERPFLVIKKYASGQKLATALEAGELDMAFHLPVDNLAKLRQKSGITIKSFQVGYQYMMWHNMRSGRVLSDLKVRKAVDIALDRSELSQELKGGKGTRSFFPEGTPYYLKDGKLHGDKAAAEKLLDEAGWIKNSKGIREKSGKELTLKLVAYPQRPGLVTIQPVIKRSLTALGIAVNDKVTSGANWDELDKIMADKDWDLLEWAQHTLPAGDPQSFINMFFRSGSGSNHAGLSSTAVDSFIDALSHAASGTARVSATEAAHKGILDIVPVSILMTPAWHVGLGTRLANYEPWGSDYYIIHSSFGLPAKTTTVGQTFMAGGTDPTSGSTGWALTSHGIAEKLFTVDKKGVVVGQIAKSVQKIDKFTWTVNLNTGHKFSDGTLVTAKLVADSLTKSNSVNSGAKASLGKMTMKTVNDFTLTINSTRATPIMDAVLAEWAFPIFLEKPGPEFIFTGPYRVATFAKGQYINLAANLHYPQATDRPFLIIKKYASGASLATALEAKEIDLAFHLPVDKLPQLRQVSGITIKSFPVGYQYMMWHNMRSGRVLADAKVRKAIDIALDRSELTQELKGGEGTRSFFPKNTPYYLQDTKLNGDKSGAEKLLDEAGWVKNSKGIREKSGKELTLKLVAYPQRPGLVTIQPVIKRSLTALGIVVNDKVTSGASWDELDKIMADKDWDLLEWAQHTLPAGDPQFFLNSFFRSGAGSNHAGLSSTVVDTLIDKVSHAAGGTDRVSATEAAHKGILDLVPVSILMTPAWHVGLSSLLANYEPWGSDYYIIHSSFGLPAGKTPTPSPAPSGTDKKDTGKTDGSTSNKDGNAGTASCAGRGMLNVFFLLGTLLFAAVL